LVSYLLMRVALLIPNRFPDGHRALFPRPAEAVPVPARVPGAHGSAGPVPDRAGLSQLLGASTTSPSHYPAPGLISLVRDYNIRRLERAGNRQYVALLKPFTTIVKFVALTIIALVWAERAGYNMSTIIAGLGVGSLAVALAAQKTLENVIGAITLYSARPVNPGDLCRFGNMVGVVEEIGLRSTMIRTLNRTMLAVPNSCSPPWRSRTSVTATASATTGTSSCR
jgi:MscS family membrane protein